jgi:large subunit ribosomal protein L31e
MRDIKKFVRKNYGTTDVRLDPALNKFVWSNGARSIPPKVRLLLSRRPVEDETKKGKYYTLVNNIIVPNFKNLKAKRVKSTVATE